MKKSILYRGKVYYIEDDSRFIFGSNPTEKTVKQHLCSLKEGRERERGREKERERKRRKKEEERKRSEGTK